MWCKSIDAFKVEENLTKPKELLYTNTLKEIFSSLFDKKKILTYEIDTKQNEFYNYSRKTLLQGLVISYKNHYPMVVYPDMIWLLILQGYSKFMEKYSELVRHKYVNFEGKKEININRYGMDIKNFDVMEWKGIFKEINEKIEKNVGKNIVENLTPNFSTTNDIILTTGHVTIMSAMKQYFAYNVLGGGCGVSEIILEGSVNDWEKILKKTKFLEDYAMKWWTKHLIPIIEKIIETKKSLVKKANSVSKELKEFWKKFIRVKGEGDAYNPHIINGWIVKFFPDYNGEFPSVKEEIVDHDMVRLYLDENYDSMVECPVNLINLNSDGTKTLYETKVYSGFYGMAQDKKTFAVRPIIGYALVVEKEEKKEMTVGEKEELIKKFFQ